MAKRGPGKFESDLDAALYELALDQSVVDEDVGSSSEPPGTWAGLLRGGASLALAIKESGESGESPFRDVDADDLAFLRQKGKAGVIVMEHDSGRVEVAYYPTDTKLDRDWAQVKADLYVADYEANSEEDMLRDETIEPSLKGKGPVFRIQTWKTEKRDQSRHRGGRPMLGFRITMTEPGGSPEVVYEGEEYSPSPSIELDSDRTLDDIVAFFVNDYDDENRTARQKEVVREYGDTLSAEAGTLFGEDSEREENSGGQSLKLKPVVGRQYRLVHPEGDETVTVVDRQPDEFLVKPGFKRGALVVVRLETGSDKGEIGPVNIADLRPLRAKNGSTAWLVLLNGEQTDIVYFSDAMDADDVKHSLVNHDGYDPRITVKKRQRRKTHAPDALAENASKAKLRYGDIVRVGPAYRMGDSPGHGRRISDEWTGGTYTVVSLPTLGDDVGLARDSADDPEVWITAKRLTKVGLRKATES